MAHVVWLRHGCFPTLKHMRPASDLRHSSNAVWLVPRKSLRHANSATAKPCGSCLKVDAPRGAPDGNSGRMRLLMSAKTDPLPEQAYTREPRSGEEACGNTCMGTMANQRLAMRQRLARCGVFALPFTTPHSQHQHETTSLYEGAKMPGTHAQHGH